MRGLTNVTFQWKILIPSLVIAVSGSLKTFGNLIAAQKFSEPDLKKVDFRTIRKGLMADGFSTALAGFMGAMAAGVIFCLFAFFPRFTAVISQMPKPVLGASLIFAGCFMIVTGLQEMFLEKWEQRRTFVVGIALFMGLSTAFMPELYARAPHFIQSFFTDPLPTASIVAVVMNQIINLDKLFKRGENPPGILP